MAHVYSHPIAIRFRGLARACAAGLCLCILAVNATYPQAHRESVTQDRINEVAGALLDLPAHFASLTARRRTSEPAARYSARLRGYLEAADRAARATSWMRSVPVPRDGSPENVQRWKRLATQSEHLAEMSAASRKAVAELLRGGKASVDPGVLARAGSKLVGVLDTSNAIVQELRDARP